MKTHSTIRLAPLILALTAVATTQAAAQEAARVQVSPATLSLEVGETATVSATAYDAAGNVIDVPFIYSPGTAAGVWPSTGPRARSRRSGAASSRSWRGCWALRGSAAR